jgi:DNA-binding CsgD family transcriptional regulator
MQPLLRIAFATKQPERSTGTGSAVELTRVSEEVLVIRIPSETSLAESAAGLTESERAVVALAMAGKSNAMIAAERGSSPRTIANQLASAYQKLGLSGRRELRAGLRGRRAR